MLNLLIINGNIGSFPGTKVWNNVSGGHSTASMGKINVIYNLFRSINYDSSLREKKTKNGHGWECLNPKSSLKQSISNDILPF